MAYASQCPLWNRALRLGTLPESKVTVKLRTLKAVAAAIMEAAVGVVTVAVVVVMAIAVVGVIAVGCAPAAFETATAVLVFAAQVQLRELEQRTPSPRRQTAPELHKAQTSVEASSAY